MTTKDYEGERQERQLDAAEYVIGTMSAVERSAFEDALAFSPEARGDVRFWEGAFGALNASVSPEVVPQVVWERIDRALPGVGGVSAAEVAAGAPVAGAAVPAAVAPGRSGADQASSPTGPEPDASRSGEATPVGAAPVPLAANDNRLAGLRRSRGRWRFVGIAASLAALTLGWLLGNAAYDLDPRSSQFLHARAPDAVPGVPDVPADARRYVAVVQADPGQPALVVNIDAGSGDVTVRSLGMERPEGKSLEVWYVPQGQAPVSVGLLGEGDIELDQLKASEGDLLAISLEPAGGAPGGVATGPVVYSGKLVEAPE